MLGVLILCIVLGIFIVARAYMHPMQPFEYMLTVILLICLLGFVVIRPFPIHSYSIFPIRSMMEPFTQVLAKLDTTMLSDVVQLPNTIRSQVGSGMNYLIDVQKKLTNMAKADASKESKNYQKLSKDTLKDTDNSNLSDDKLQQIGKEYIILDDMLSTLESNHKEIYKSITSNIKSVNDFDDINQELALDKQIQDLSSRINANEAKINTMKANEAKIDNTMEKDIQKLQEETAQLRTSMNALKTRQKNFKFEQLDKQIQDLSSRINANNAKIDKMKSSPDNAATMDKDIQTLQKEIAQMQTSRDELKIRLAELKIALSD